MSLSTVLLVDQSSIPASFDAVSLFVNGRHVLDADEANDHPIEDIASNLAAALDTDVTQESLSGIDLARYLAGKREKLSELEASIKEGNADLDDWVQGYTNDDVLGALGLDGVPEEQEEKPIGLDSALEELEEDPSLKLYEVEIGLFDISSDPNTAFESHLVVVAAESPEGAAELARQACEEAIPAVSNIAFSPMNAASEIDLPNL